MTEGLAIKKEADLILDESKHEVAIKTEHTAGETSDQTKKKKAKGGRPRVNSDVIEHGGTTTSASDSSMARSYGPTDSNTTTTTRSVNEVIPKVWIISNFAAPIMAQIAVEVLKKGDKVVLGCSPGGEKEQELLKQADRLRQRCPDRCIVVELDIKNFALCQSSISKALVQFGRIDIVVNCTNQVYVGALEETEEWHMRGQLDHTFYGAVNMIQAALPIMRRQYFGHFVNITDVTGNIGTPGLAILSGAMHALEGYLEALACEVAPFNLKVTIVENPMEVTLLTSPLVFADENSRYGPETQAGKLREILSKTNTFPTLAFKSAIYTVVSVGGLENPPGRIIVGQDAIAQIKDKLAVLSEDLEDYSAISKYADFEEYNLI